MKTRTVHLDAVCERIDYGFTASADFSIREPRLLRITDIQEGAVDWNHVPGCRITPQEEAEKRLSAGDIVFARTGATTGKCFLIEHAPRAVFASYLIRLRATDEALPQYLYAFFQSQGYWHQIKGAVRGAAQGGVNSTTLSSLVLPLPELTEQRRIAGQLEQVDRLRRTRRYALDLTDSFLPAAFLNFFGDPKQNPNSWPLQYLSAVCSKFSDGPFGSNLKSSHYRSSGIRVVRLQNIGVGEFLDEDKAFISEEHFATLQKHGCMPGDVLIGTMGDPNLRACIQPANIPIALNKADCIQARPDPKHLKAPYLQCLLNLPSTLYLVPGMVHGQTRARVSMGELADLPIPVPPLPLQQQFASLVEKVERLRAVQREALRQAEHLFASLLHREFND